MTKIQSALADLNEIWKDYGTFVFSETEYGSTVILTTDKIVSITGSKKDYPFTKLLEMSDSYQIWTENNQLKIRLAFTKKGARRK